MPGIAGGKEKGRKYLQEHLYVQFKIPDYLKLAKLSHAEAAKECGFESAEHFRSYLYREDHHVPLCVFKALTFKRGLLGMEQPPALERRQPFQVPRTLEGFAGRKALNFERMHPIAPDGGQTNGNGHAAVTMEDAAAAAVPEPEVEGHEYMVSRIQWLSRQLNRPTQDQRVALYWYERAQQPTTQPAAPGLEVWPIVFRQALEQMADMVVAKSLQHDHAKRELHQREVELAQMRRERDQYKSDYEAANKLLDEAPSGPSPAVAGLVMQAVTQAATRTGSPVAGKIAADDLTARLGKFPGPGVSS